MTEQTQVFPSLTGQHVVYVDSKGREHAALVTNDWRGGREFGCLNVVFTSSDENQTDTWGRKIERDSSVQHRTGTTVHGKYWVMPDDSERNPYTPPA